MFKDLVDPPDRLQPTRIHYICPCTRNMGDRSRICASDVYRDTRQITVKCGICQGTWSPHLFGQNSLAYGIEEINPHPARYDYPRCAKHGLPKCKECEKAELYGE